MAENDKQAFENTTYRIFPALHMLVRDANLTEAAASKYKIGTTVREPAFCDATCKIGGMVTTHRYAIISNHYLNTTPLVEKGKMWGLCICQKDSRYKVIDIHRYKNKTQILLLHDDEVGQLFKNIKYFSKEILIRKCRELFEKKCVSPPIPEVATSEWLDRCAQPIGIDGNAR